MRISKTCLRMVAFGSILLISFSCSEEEKELPPKPVIVSTPEAPDLAKAIQKRIENKPVEAIALLRKYNADFPNSAEILVQLSRALLDNKQYSLAAFRFEQAIFAGGGQELMLECAEAYQLGGDLDSAQDRYMKYLKSFPNDSKTWLTTARLLVENGRETEALNAFEQSGKLPNSEDCIVAGNLYLKKNILVQAQHWFEKSSKKQIKPSTGAFIGLLQVKLALGDENAAEALIFDLEKHFPGTLDNTADREKYASLIRKRKLNEFAERGINTQNLSATELAQALLRAPKKEPDPVISAGPKLGPFLSEASNSTELEENAVNEENTSLPVLSLAEAFAPNNEEVIEPTPLELGWNAYLSNNYRTALLHARDAIKENTMDSEAWRLSSQVHFQLGEIREAEMTILEAIRHNPKDLKTRMDYLSIARETLSPTRYLGELEKTHERFPDSGEILWQLARRYHIVERMPVTAGILYQRLLKITPEGGGLHTQAKMELIKIQNL